MSLLSFLFLSLALSATCSFAQDSIYSIKLKDIDGNERALEEFKGKVLLIVNTASNCGFSGQLEGMQTVYDTYRDRGLEVLAFPSNDFLGQEPGTSQEIKSFCTGKYNSTFHIFEKAEVTGKNKQQLFKYLTEQGPEDLQGSVKWNFEKFLVGRDGQLAERYSSLTKPESDKITSKIEQLLESRK